MAADTRNDFVFSALDLATVAVSITGASLVSTVIAAPANSLNRNVVKRLQVTAVASGAQAALFAGIFDGASTSSTVLALFCITAQSNTQPMSPLDLDNLHIKGSVGAATCVGTTAAPAASTSVAITAQSYILGKQPATVQFNS